MNKRLSTLILALILLLAVTISSPNTSKASGYWLSGKWITDIPSGVDADLIYDLTVSGKYVEGTVTSDVPFPYAETGTYLGQVTGDKYVTGTTTYSDNSMRKQVFRLEGGEVFTDIYYGQNSDQYISLKLLSFGKSAQTSGQNVDFSGTWTYDSKDMEGEYIEETVATQLKQTGNQVTGRMLIERDGTTYAFTIQGNANGNILKATVTNQYGSYPVEYRMDPNDKNRLTYYQADFGETAIDYRIPFNYFRVSEDSNLKKEAGKVIQEVKEATNKGRTKTTQTLTTGWTGTWEATGNKDGNDVFYIEQAGNNIYGVYYSNRHDSVDKVYGHFRGTVQADGSVTGVNWWSTKSTTETPNVTFVLTKDGNNMTMVRNHYPGGSHYNTLTATKISDDYPKDKMFYGGDKTAHIQGASPQSQIPSNWISVDWTGAYQHLSPESSREDYRFMIVQKGDMVYISYDSALFTVRDWAGIGRIQKDGSVRGITVHALADIKDEQPFVLVKHGENILFVNAARGSIGGNRVTTAKKIANQPVDSGGRELLSRVYPDSAIDKSRYDTDIFASGESRFRNSPWLTIDHNPPVNIDWLQGKWIDERDSNIFDLEVKGNNFSGKLYTGDAITKASESKGRYIWDLSGTMIHPRIAVAEGRRGDNNDLFKYFFINFGNEIGVITYQDTNGKLSANGSTLFEGKVYGQSFPREILIQYSGALPNKEE